MGCGGGHYLTSLYAGLPQRSTSLLAGTILMPYFVIRLDYDLGSEWATPDAVTRKLFQLDAIGHCL